MNHKDILNAAVETGSWLPSQVSEGIALKERAAALVQKDSALNEFLHSARFQIAVNGLMRELKLDAGRGIVFAALVASLTWTELTEAKESAPPSSQGRGAVAMSGIVARHEVSIAMTTAPPINKPRPPAQTRTAVSIPVTFTRRRRLAEGIYQQPVYRWVADDAVKGDDIEEVTVSGTIIDWAHYTVNDPNWGNHGWTEAIVLTEGKLIKRPLYSLKVTE